MHASPAAAAETRPASILLISIDTLRADHLGLYGYPRPTDPELARRTRDFVVFRRAYTTVPLTLPAHLTMMTGLYPLELGVFNNRQTVPLGDDRAPLLAELLSAAGYRTAAVVASAVLSSSTGLDIGFSEFRQPARGQRPAKLNADQVNAVAAELMEDASRPLFLFVHYYDAHEPFTYPDRDGCEMRADAALRGELLRRGLAEVAYYDVLNRSRVSERRDAKSVSLEEMVARYDAGVRYSTRHAAQLLDLWDTTPHGQESLVIITSDHGEGLGQHGFWSHGMNLYDEALHVPLLVRWPSRGGAAASTADSVDAVASLLDVLPTVLEAAGVRSPGPTSGISLSRVRRQRRSRPPLMAQRMRYILPNRPAGVRNWRPGDGYAVLGGRFKRVEDDGSGVELFDRSTDPLETKNLSGTGIDAERRLSRLLVRWRKETEVPVAWPPRRNERRLERLRSLGYTQ